MTLDLGDASREKEREAVATRSEHESLRETDAFRGVCQRSSQRHPCRYVVPMLRFYAGRAGARSLAIQVAGKRGAEGEENMLD